MDEMDEWLFIFLSKRLHELDVEQRQWQVIWLGGSEFSLSPVIDEETQPIAFTGTFQECEKFVKTPSQP